MDETERHNKIVDSLWWWLPVRWHANGSTYEVARFELTGDATDGGVDVYVKKDEGSEVAVHFDNAECYGDLRMAPEGAKGRIYTEVE